MKNIINTLNTDLASTSVERCLCTRQSFKSRKKERLIRSFETYNEVENEPRQGWTKRIQSYGLKKVYCLKITHPKLIINCIPNHAITTTTPIYMGYMHTTVFI